MNIRFDIRLVSALVLALPQVVLAKDTYLRFSAFDYTTLKWAGVVVILAGVAAILINMLARLKLQGSTDPTPKSSKKRPQNRFRKRARALGFRLKESKVLIQIASWKRCAGVVSRNGRAIG